MQTEPQVSFVGIPVDDAIEQACWQEIEKLERYYHRITSCRVVVSQPHKRHRKGNSVSFRIDLHVPGDELVVNREPADNHPGEDVHVALRSAFDAAGRQLRALAEKRAGRVKDHGLRPEGRVTSLNPLAGTGSVATDDGRELPFDRSGVQPGAFEELELGARVEFIEQPGANGPGAKGFVARGIRVLG